MVEKTEHSSLWPSLYDPFRTFGSRLAEWVNPASEASSSDETYDIAIELPGVSEDDIDLTLRDSVLSISGEKRSQEEKKGDTWYFSERQYGAFRRSFRLPDDAEGSKAAAHMADGILHISVPKKAPAPKAEDTRIQIKRHKPIEDR